MNDYKIVIAEIIDEEVVFSFEDLRRACRTEPELMQQMIEYGLIQPISGNDVATWYFTADAFNRLYQATRIQHDFDVDINGLDLLLELIEEVNRLRERVRFLEHE